MLELRYVHLILSVIVCSCEAVIYDLNDADFDRMPEIFAIDNYDACMRRADGLYCLLTLEINGDSNNKLFQQIKEYSRHRVKRYNHTHLDRGICVPKRCKMYNNNIKYSLEDLEPILEECLNQTIYNDYELYTNILKIYNCDDVKSDRREFDYLDCLSAAVFAGILLLNLIGSFYDKYLDNETKDDSNVPHIFTAFSIFQNWKNLCKDYTERSKEYSLKGLTGLRTFTLFLVIMSHMIYAIQSFGDNVHAFEKLQNHPIYLVSMYGLNVVQICFAMSGFFLTYKIIEYEDVAAISWIDIPKILLGRFIRLTPSYGFVLLVVISWIRYTGSGPLWSMFIGGNIQACHQYFWHHIFYLNNYVYEDTCLLSTWYVAADVQVFTVGVIVICLTKKHRMLVLSALYVLGILGTIADILQRDLYPVAVVTPEFLRAFNNDSLRLSHIRGHNNLPCFITGAIVAIVVFKWQKSGIKIQNKFLHHLSNLMPIAVAAVFLSNEFLHADGQEPPLLTKLLFAVVFRIVLSAVLALWFISIFMKFDTPLCRILSWSGWVVPSRLAYSVYVNHMVLIILLMGLKTTRENLTFLHFITTYIGVTVISFIFGTMLYIFIEAPCCRLMDRTPIMKKYILKKMQKKSD